MLFRSDRVAVFDRQNAALVAGRPSIKFTTQNVGIKIYQLYAEKLQSSSSTASCKRFPVELNQCKCYGLNISDFNAHPYRCGGNQYGYADVFLPGLSTRHSPRLANYGGYSQAELDDMFGTNVVTAGGFVPMLTSYIIPDQPYGCDRSASISLRNYVNTQWKLDIKGLSTNHSDATIEVSEQGDMTAKFARYIFNDFYFRAVNNESWKRFFTKVSISGSVGVTTIWKDQIKTFLSPDDAIGSENFTIDLQNPYLHKLTQLYYPNPAPWILAPPSGDLVSGSDLIFGQPVSYGDPGLTSRGDETSTVTLTIRNKPRKQVLAFELKPPSATSSLQKGFFHPNSGLTNDAQYHNKSPMKNGTIYYDEPLYSDGYDQGTVLTGRLNSLVKNLFNGIYNFSLHKKPRLYLSINNRWYQAVIPNRGGFVHMGAKYVGTPSYFEYVQRDTDSQHIPGLFPVAPKKHLSLFFVGNHPSSFIRNRQTKTMILFDKFKAGNSRTIVLPGSRYYFMIPERDTGIPVSAANIRNLAGISAEEATQISTGSTIKLQDNTRWIYIGPDVRSSTSYIKTNYGYLYHNFSDSHIDYAATNSLGYVYNTDKSTNQTVHLYNDRGEMESNTVLRKKLVVEYDKRAKKNTSPLVRQFSVYTHLQLQNKVRPGYNMIDPLLIHSSADSADDVIKPYSLTIFAPTLWLQAETDPYLTDFLKTKWGDVIYHDGTILDSLTSNNLDVSYWYPKPLYQNSFYKILVNNHQQNKHRYVLHLLNDGQDYTIDHNDLVYYTIHQKYNTTYDTDQKYSTTVSDYQNYLPFMDINLLSLDTSSPIRTILPLNNAIVSGTMMTTSLYNTLPDNHSWDIFDDPSSDQKMWINLPSDTRLVSSFVPTQTIYSTTLRIDDPIYWLERTSTQTTTNPSDDCTREFRPRLPTLSTITNPWMPSHMNTRSVSRNKFYTSPIYCDTDNPNPSDCGEQPCRIKNIGSVGLTSTYKMATNTTLSLNSIPANTDIPYILSYDAGHYNAFGVQSLTAIKRFEIDPDSWLGSNNSCSATILKPLNLRQSTIDKRYQDALTTVNTHSTLVQNTDLMANEILFRMLYGEKTPVNKQMLLMENQNLTATDFLGYSDPKLTAKDIYGQILYNYDRNVTSNNVAYNSTLTINGKATVGQSMSLTIGSTSIDLSINRVVSDIEQAVVIEGTIGSKRIYGKVYIEKYRENSLIVVDGGGAAPQPVDDNETITPVQTYTTPAQYAHYAYAHPQFFNPLMPRVRYPVNEPNCTMSVTPGKTWTPGVKLATVIFPPRVTSPSRPVSTSCTSGFDQCKDFEYAYCRRNKTQRCASCPDQFEANDGQDFEYEFSVCRHTMKLYGHTYREKHTEPLIPPVEEITISDGFGNDCDITEPALDDNGIPSSSSTVSPGIARGCWGPRADPRCQYVVLDVFSECKTVAACAAQHFPGGDWTEYDVRKSCLITASTTRTVYRRKTIKQLAPYNPTCPSTICTISYNNYSISITYPNVTINVDSQGRISQTGTKTECILLDSFQNTCPYIDVSTFPSSFTIQETMSSECSACNQLPLNIEIPKQTQNISTIKEKRKCIIGTFVYGIINDKPLIIFADSAYGGGAIGLLSPPCEACSTLFSAPCYGNGATMTAQVGGGFEWFACLGSLQYSRSFGKKGDGSPGRVSSRPVQDVVCQFRVPPIAEGPAAVLQRDEWMTSINSSYTQSSKGMENDHIPVDDIIQGVVPRSQSDVPLYKTYTFKSEKIRPTSDGTGAEKTTWDVNVVVAYYEYQYIRPKTIQDTLKPASAICANQKTVAPTQDIPELSIPEPPEEGGTWDFVGQVNKSGQYQCWSLGFPSWFTLPGWENWWGWEFSGLGFKPNIPNTYVDTKAYTEKNNGCASTLRSYYKHSESNRGNSDWYAPPMPCAERDWNCWYGQHMRNQFLRARTGETWV